MQQNIKNLSQKLQIIKFIGVYQADGGFKGEMTYVFKKIIGDFNQKLGEAKCNLCSITHSGPFMKKKIEKIVSEIEIQFEFIHLNERSKEILEFTQDKTPCLIGQKSDNSLILIVDSKQLEVLNGSVTNFFKLIEENLQKLQ